MCSSMCDSPARPMTSLREPTRYQIWTVTTGAFGTSTSSTFMPLARIDSRTVEACTGVPGHRNRTSGRTRRGVRIQRLSDMRTNAPCEGRMSGAHRRQDRGFPPLGNLAELTAGAEDIAPLALADEGVEAGLSQHRLEAQDRRLLRTPEPGVGEFVEGNQVDFAAHPAQELHQAPGVLLGVVDPRQQHVFEGEPPAGRQGKS